MKSVRSGKDLVSSIMKRYAVDWEKIFAIHMTDKGLAFKIYKELLKTQQ